MHNHVTLGYVTDSALASVSHEDANALTHINLAFGAIRDGLLDMSQLPHIREIDRIRDYNATLKVVLSIGARGAFRPWSGARMPARHSWNRARKPCANTRWTA